MASSNRVLVKLKPNVGLAAAASKVNLRPLHDRPPQLNVFGLSDTPAWYLADLPDTTGPNPWDLAHAQVAEQLGVDASAVLFAEPDLDQTFDDGSESVPGGAVLAAAPPAGGHTTQDANNNKVTGPFGGAPSFGWHLGENYTQLASARSAVPFQAPRTRVAHIDTGFDRSHVAKPERIVLEHSFVEGDPDPNKAESRAALGLLPENLDHGTGTIGILAGSRVNFLNDDFLGGAPGADIVTLRIADSVILFKVSAFAQALQFAIDNRCDVVSISMGGLPSRAWGELVNKAYEAGICICAAAGNNISGLPSHHVVYPARYHRTVAVCGVMANGQPYYGITGRQLQGSWGPDSSMTAAIAAYTPNIPWAVFKQSPEIRENGEGTSSATPQVAAAATIWFEKYKDRLPRDWRRVEAVRHALFSSAKAQGVDLEHFGRGILQANAALSVQPDLNRPQTPPDKDSFAFLRVLTGLGITDAPPREEMFNLELTQLYLANDDVEGVRLQDLIADPATTPSDKAVKEFMDAVIANPKASVTLRKHLAARYSSVVGGAAPRFPVEIVPPPRPVSEKGLNLVNPTFRRLRSYAVDPSFSTQLETAGINEVVLKVRWEELNTAEFIDSSEDPKTPGLTGEYVKVVDTDASGKTYDPVDLNEPKLLAQDGWPPAEGNPQFHQQMVYAVAMKTIEHFERALGRRVLWRARQTDNQTRGRFVRQLEIQPHALRGANAFYSPQGVSLLFGYFEASADDPGDHVAGSRVYSCLSHDIVAHETTHAILDGMHREFNDATNLDVLAFHEAFADIVALMQHFTIPEILENVITRTRGNLESESILGSLAVQFGRAVGGRGALRDAIGKFSKDGTWTRIKPDPTDYEKTKEPHARGALLVAAVFDAFLAIYKTRIADLLRISTGGTGVLRAGAIHPDLTRRLSAEASKTAGHMLNICIRALDYIPPVDITFGEYLRGLITGDADLVPDDPYHYRVAFVESFRKRGIYPLDLDTLSVDTLRWQGVDLFEGFKKDPTTEAALEVQLRKFLDHLKRYADICFYSPTRKALYEETCAHLDSLETMLAEIFGNLAPELRKQFGALIGVDPDLPFKICDMRRAMRVGPDGQHKPQIILGLTQSRLIEVDNQEFNFLGGATLIVDLRTAKVQYAISKSIN
ncbi:MAG: S8 family serine peptidase, partial [Acidobacteriota bacterium]